MDRQSVKANLFLIGAPKCGTTSLANYLASVDEIYLPPSKEPHYYSEDMYRIYDAKDYEELYRPGRKSRYRLDASVWYLYSEVAIERIIKEVPDAKFIAMVRNPVDMVPALFRQMRVNQEEPINNLVKAWHSQEKRRTGPKASIFTRTNKYLLYGEACALGSQLERVSERVGRQNLLVLSIEDLGDKAFVDKALTEFLGISAPSGQIPKSNTVHQRRSILLAKIVRLAGMVVRFLRIRTRFGILNWLTRANKVGAQRESLSPDFRRELQVYFQEEIGKLEMIMGRDLTHWKH